ncbi:MAG: hypothetical protein EA401_03890 [Planctomycetota bacterium]|nr:MAG: hypothetical protein EA401_03890 [Planctomycetota bacterium]
MVEVIIVIALVIILTSVTVPGSMSSLRVSRVNQAVAMLDMANNDAQRFARASHSSDDGFFGIRLHGGQPPHRISVIYGSDSSAPALTGLSRSLNPGVLIYHGESPLEHDLVWFYQPAKGFPVAAGALQAGTIAIGTPGSPVSENLSIRSNDGASRVQCRIFEVGLFNRERIQ